MTQSEGRRARTANRRSNPTSDSSSTTSADRRKPAEPAASPSCEVDRPSRQSRTDRAGQGREQVVLNDAQRALVEAHIGLVGMHMRNFVATPLHPMRQREYDDLFQEGCMALTRAAARYDPNRNGPFASYALLRIRGRIHTALHEYFATVRVPTRKIKEAARQQGKQQTPKLHMVQELSERRAARLEADDTGIEPQETIRHLLRERYERSIELALADLRQRSWRLRDPTPIMERIASERLLISTDQERTSLRGIASEAGVSSGRACEYEQLLTKTVRTYMADDIQVRLLLRWARRDARGFNAPLDARQQNLLRRADARRFLARFRQLGQSRKAEVVYELVAHSTEALDEVVHNLYRLCGQSTSCGFLCVA